MALTTPSRPQNHTLHTVAALLASLLMVGLSAAPAHGETPPTIDSSRPGAAALGLPGVANALPRAESPAAPTDAAPADAAPADVAGPTGSKLRRSRSRELPPPQAGIYEPASEDERRLIYHAMNHCNNASPRFAKPYLMLELLRIEAEHDVPPSMRGITLAAWCGEAAYRTEDIIGDGGAAVGILQLHPHISRLCGSPSLRQDPRASARCWLRNLQRIYPKARRLCGKKRAWRAAELWLSQGGLKSNYSCKKVSGHMARLMRWQRQLKRQEERGQTSNNLHRAEQRVCGVVQGRL